VTEQISLDALKNLLARKVELETAVTVAPQADDSLTVIRLRRVDAASLAGKPIPERDWYVPGLIPSRNVTLLYGDGGTGKSLLMLQCAAAGVTDGMFCGHPVKQGPVEFFTAEDEADELHRRLIDIARHAGSTLDAYAGLNLTSLSEQDALLSMLDGNKLVPTALFEELSAVLTETNPALLVLDTLADIYGGNEIIRAQARQFIGMLRRLAITHDCAVVVLAHPSLTGMDKGTSGSTGWSNSVRSRLFFKRVDGDETGDARVLEVGKANYGKVGVTINMQWRDGVFVLAGLPTDQIAKDARVDSLFLELLGAGNKLDGWRVSVAPTAGNYAPKVFKEKPPSSVSTIGVSRKDFSDAMHRLLQSEQILSVPYGRPGDQRFHLICNFQKFT
jgi:RecA-family ATPase